MSVSKRVRFEVFKRDDFTCAYCGRTPPAVVLEVDHIVPRAEGGGDEPENLTTSCSDCNRGKSAVPLTNRSAVEDLAARTALMREREEQLRAYQDAQRLERERVAADIREVEDYWAESYGGWDRLGQYDLLNRGVLRRYLRDLPVTELLDAVDITVGRYRRPVMAATRYFGGVLREKLRRRQEAIGA